MFAAAHRRRYLDEMSIPMPEGSPAKTVVQSTLLGILSGVPLFGGGLAGAVQGVVDATSRARDEEWWAMVSARLVSLEADVRAKVRLDDDEFLAARHRLEPAAQATADEEKRHRLAAALAHSGSWSEVNRDRRERLERLLIDLSPLEILILRIYYEPRVWLVHARPGRVHEFGKPLADSIEELIAKYLIANDRSFRPEVQYAIESVQKAGLVSPRKDSASERRLYEPRLTALGSELISYLRSLDV